MKLSYRNTNGLETGTESLSLQAHSSIGKYSFCRLIQEFPLTHECRFHIAEYGLLRGHWGQVSNLSPAIMCLSGNCCVLYVFQPFSYGFQ